MLIDEQFANLDGWIIKNNTSASNEDSYLLAANVTLEAGDLVITAKNQTAGGRSWTSGHITSRTNLPNYFRAEVRAKLTFEQGMWCAPLWFRPSNGAGAYEIDVVENYGRELNKAHYTLHSGTSYQTDHQKSGLTTTLANPEGWHTWVLEKLPNQITASVDGVVQKQWTPSDTNLAASWASAFESGRQWQLRSNVQVGGSFGGQPDGTTDWTNTRMVVDYIQVTTPGAVTTGETFGHRSSLWLGRGLNTPGGGGSGTDPVDGDTTYGNFGYGYAGVAQVLVNPPVTATPANRTRQPVRRVHESLPTPTLVNGRPT